MVHSVNRGCVLRVKCVVCVACCVGLRAVCCVVRGVRVVVCVALFCAFVLYLARIV